MIEVEIGGAVVGSVCDPQVTVSDPTVQLLRYGVFLQGICPTHKVLRTISFTVSLVRLVTCVMAHLYTKGRIRGFMYLSSF